eukprot:4323438-Pleurochrysis_carterae.AAC.1
MATDENIDADTAALDVAAETPAATPGVADENADVTTAAPDSLGQHIGTDIRWRQRPREQPTVLCDEQAGTAWYV